MFNALSYIVTGSCNQQGEVRAAIVAHMYNIEDYLTHGWIREYSSVREYIAGEQMDCDAEWSTEIEIVTFADSFNKQHGSWEQFGLDRLRS